MAPEGGHPADMEGQATRMTAPAVCLPGAPSQSSYTRPAERLAPRETCGVDRHSGDYGVCEGERHKRRWPATSYVSEGDSPRPTKKGCSRMPPPARTPCCRHALHVALWVAGTLGHPFWATSRADEPASTARFTCEIQDSTPHRSPADSDVPIGQEKYLGHTAKRAGVQSVGEVPYFASSKY